MSRILISALALTHQPTAERQVGSYLDNHHSNLVTGLMLKHSLRQVARCHSAIGWRHAPNLAFRHIQMTSNPDTGVFPHATGIALQTVKAHEKDEDLVLWGSWCVLSETPLGLRNRRASLGFAPSYKESGSHLRRRAFHIDTTK